MLSAMCAPPSARAAEISHWAGLDMPASTSAAIGFVTERASFSSSFSGSRSAQVMMSRSFARVIAT